jgi:uncharacterized protein (TIGR03382 family)
MTLRDAFMFCSGITAGAGLIAAGSLLWAWLARRRL